MRFLYRTTPATAPYLATFLCDALDGSGARRTTTGGRFAGISSLVGTYRQRTGQAVTLLFRTIGILSSVPHAIHLTAAHEHHGDNVGITTSPRCLRRVLQQEG